MRKEFYEVLHTPRASIPNLPMFAWLTTAEANGYVDDENQLVDVFTDYNGQMVPERVKLFDLEIVNKA